LIVESPGVGTTEWIAAARGMGASVVAITDGTREEAADLSIAAGDLAARSVEPRFSPFGYRRVVGGRFGVVGSVVAGRPGVDGLVDVLSTVGSGVDVFGEVGGVRLPEGVSVLGGGLDTVLVDRLRPYAGVIDHPALHPSTQMRAHTLMSLAAAGVPLVAMDVDDELTRMIGEEMAGLLTGTGIDDLADPETRDRHSVLLRRLALGPGSQTTTWRQIAESLGITVTDLPTISVLLSTRRPQFLDHALEQARRQTYPNVELVLILHGEGFTITDTEITSRYQRPITILRIPATTVYGEALNRGTKTATGTLISKMDDDDWYSKHHLWDLANALDYSGADLVGKAAEFVYLEELDTTIRRMVDGSETYGNRNLGGGTFLIRRDTLHTIGGWRRVPFNEDRGTIEDVLAADGIIYRTHGHGYLLNRHIGAHLWEAGTSYFEGQAALSRPGISHEWALTDQHGRLPG
jgi:hypothetical protein